jgi:hypothetical protein
MNFIISSPGLPPYVPLPGKRIFVPSNGIIMTSPQKAGFSCPQYQMK